GMIGPGVARGERVRRLGLLATVRPGVGGSHPGRHPGERGTLAAPASPRPPGRAAASAVPPPLRRPRRPPPGGAAEAPGRPQPRVAPIAELRVVQDAELGVPQRLDGVAAPSVRNPAEAGRPVAAAAAWRAARALQPREVRATIRRTVLTVEAPIHLIA